MAVYGYTSTFFPPFIQRETPFHDLLFASLDDIAPPKWGLLLKEGVFFYRSKFFPLRVDPMRKEGKQENGRVSTP